MPAIDRRTFLARTLAASASLACAVAGAVGTPELKGLQIVVPTPPGTQPDVIARWLVEPMAKLAGVPGSVLNRPGAAGAIAADAVLAAAPDSGTLLLGGLDHVAYSHLNSNRRALDAFVDFVPVGTVNRDTWLLVASNEHASGTLPALVEASRANRPLSYGSAGEGSTAHLLTARLCQALGIQAQHVPYKESYLPDLIAGRLHFALAPTPALLATVRGGRVRPLASLTDERLAVIDGVPTIRELGWPDQVFYGGLFLFAPSTLAPHARRLNEWFVQVQRQPEIMALYRGAAIEPTPLDLDATRQAVVERLRTVDAMRLAVFGRSR